MDDIRIRYYSKTGNTKQVAEYISDCLNVRALEINDDDYKSKCSLLFLGGAPYANIMAPKLREYVYNLDLDYVDEVALFTTSNWSKRTVKAIKDILNEKGIKVYDDYLYVHMLMVNRAKEKAYKFALDIVNEHNKIRF